MPLAAGSHLRLIRYPILGADLVSFIVPILSLVRMCPWIEPSLILGHNVCTRVLYNACVCVGDTCEPQSDTRDRALSRFLPYHYVIVELLNY